ncbi:MAG: hypothetical protein K2X97_11080, partial [Mycobacteriaceae bacterium]|nr:hypothetical protein [Mycobacteriaceae bacterium]
AASASPSPDSSSPAADNSPGFTSSGATDHPLTRSGLGTDARRQGPLHQQHYGEWDARRAGPGMLTIVLVVATFDGTARSLVS